MVNAQSSLDKIVISVSTLTKDIEMREVSSIIESGLRRIPPLGLIESETLLVAMEESAASAKPSTADFLLSQLGDTVAPAFSTSCSLSKGEEHIANESSWAPSGYYFANYDWQALITNNQLPSDAHQDVSSSKGHALPSRLGIYNYSTVDISQQNHPSPNDDALFIGIVDPPNFANHLKALEEIYIAAVQSSVDPDEIRPFGIGGFVLFGNSNVLTNFNEKLTHIQARENADTVSEATVKSAKLWSIAYMCNAPSSRMAKEGSWVDSVVMHPYFHFWIKGSNCVDQDLNRVTSIDKEFKSPVILYTQYLFSKPTVENSTPIVPHIKYNICIDGGEYFDRNIELIRDSIISGIKSYSRMDTGIALSVKRKNIDKRCSAIAFLSPTEMHGRVKSVIDGLDYRSTKFANRVYSAYVEKLCKSDHNKPCNVSDIDKLEFYSMLVKIDITTTFIE